MFQHLERWSLPIVGQALLQDRATFTEFLSALDIDQDTLADGLATLVRSRLMDRHPATASRPETFELTAKGRDLERVVADLNEWSARWVMTVPTPGELAVEGPADAESPDAEGPAPDSDIELSLLGAFELWIGGSRVVDMAPGAQRLLALLALGDRAVNRVSLAGRLWPSASEEHAGDSLRAMLSRLDPAAREAIVSSASGVALADQVTVDLRRARRIAHRLVVLDTAGPDADVAIESILLLSRPLLPDWYDEWVVTEADDWRQLRVSALEAAARLLIARGRLAEAAGAARAAMKVEPLRESATATLIRVHLAEGNRSEALRAFTRFRSGLHEGLGLEPSEHLLRLMEDVTAQPAAR
jgi:DNA-binding SARP family transcriptional activator/DNA-binding HxlR family transcriptional regulator